MIFQSQTPRAPAAQSSYCPLSPPRLQRKCACGSPKSSLSGECAECKSKKRLQAELAIGASNDPLEQEADRIADQVLAAPAHVVATSAAPHTQRYTEKGTGKADQAPAGVQGVVRPTTIPPIVREVLRSPGQPLDPATRAFMEPRFGHNFNDVRVHTDGKAAASAQTLHARAYTINNQVVFAEGAYRPTERDSQRLIAHELTHVLQQGARLSTTRRTPLALLNAAFQPTAGSISAPTSLAIQMQPDPAASKAEEQEGEGLLNVIRDHPGSGVEIDGDIVVTYADAARWYTWRWLQLETVIGDMKREKMGLPDGLAEVSEAARVRGKVIEKRGNADISDEWIESMLSWLDRATDLYGQAQAAQARVAAQRMRTALKGLRENEEQLKRLEAALPEMQRAAFRAGDESKLLQIADTYYTIYDSLASVKDAVMTITDEIDAINVFTSKKPWDRRYWIVKDLSYHVPSVATRVAAIANAADKFNKAYAVFQVVRGLLDVLGGSKTAVDEGAARVNLFATAISAGGTLLDASAPFTLYTNMYLGPAVANALKSIGRIADLTSIENRNWIEAGELSQVKWSAEPGGKPMFLYILRVMLASRANEYDPPGEVVEYFLQNRSDFNAGAKGPGDLPPFDMWKPPDVKKIGTWVFQHRDDVWAMLYGTTKFAKQPMRARP